MSARRVVLVGGGARSGKSAFALARASELGARRAFVATAQAFDDEMRSRIAAHVQERGEAFTTYEVPHALSEALAEIDADVIVVDCLTLWLSNLLLQGKASEQIAGEVERLSEVLARRRTSVVLVTNEVGMGIVPDNALARTFRDVAGRAHQRLAAIADELHFAALGVLLRLHPEPVTVTRPRIP